MHEALHYPDRLYRCEMPDDSLAPKTPRGTPLLISYSDKPIDGQGVIVWDRVGRECVRIYWSHPDGQWSAVARDKDAPTLRSIDGCIVAGVVRWVLFDGQG
jgi:hypothetical protein